MKKAVILLALLGLLGGVGYRNYTNAVAQEDRIPRPYRAYSDADLDQLEAAHRSQVKQLKQQWDAARGVRVDAGDGGVTVGDRARDFERAQAHGRDVRDLKSQMAESEVALDKVREERRLRASEKDKLKLFVRRVTAF